MNKTAKTLTLISASLLLTLGRYPISWLLSRRRTGPKIKELPVAAARDILTASGNLWHVRMSGPPDAPPLVLIHGVNSSSLQWYHQQLAFEETHRLVIVDLPGHGRAVKCADLSIATLAEDLQFVIKTLAVEHAIFWGHSLGGMIAMEYCIRCCQPVPKALILQNCTFTNPLKTMQFPTFLKSIEQPLIRPFLRLVIRKPTLFKGLGYLNFYSGLSSLFYRFLLFTGRQSPDELRFMASLAAKTPPSVAAEAILQTLEFNRGQSLSAITVPSLVISGEADRITTPISGFLLHQAIPQSELYIAKEGHQSMLENPTAINRAVMAFLTHLD